MSIQSISAGMSAYLSTNVGASQTQQVQQAQQITQATEANESRAQERTEPKEETPRPVVNGLGQMTGSLINVIA